LLARVVPRDASLAPLGYDLDLIGGWLTSLRDAVSFVQIGAFDGSANDPIWRNVRRYGWRGVLVEPQPNAFERLRGTYAGIDGLTFLNVAVAKDAGTIPMYHIKDVGPNDPWWYGQVASFDRAHVLKHLEASDTADRVGTREVPTMTINDVLAMSLQPVDVLQIDAEGYDAALVQMVDFERFQPTVIGFEHVHLSMSDRQAVSARLREMGYRFAHGGDDTIAVKLGEGP
jgi:FkbM family methyltransferase